MNIFNITLYILTFTSITHGQGFVNLNFESANISGGSPVLANNAISGWTAYIGGVAQSSILYNNLNLGEAAISLQGPGSVFQPIEGSFFAFVQATFYAGYTTTASIGQTGTIPTDAQSLIFWGDTSVSGVANNMQVTFDGTVIPYASIGSGSSYAIYSADISGLSGRTGQLLFTSYNNTYATIDNIQFSAVPEPNTYALCLFGIVGMLGYKIWLQTRA